MLLRQLEGQDCPADEAGSSAGCASVQADDVAARIVLVSSGQKTTARPRRPGFSRIGLFVCRASQNLGVDQFIRDPRVLKPDVVIQPRGMVAGSTGIVFDAPWD